jgi:hypothetical protein
MILPILAEAAAAGITGSFTLGMAGLGSGIGIGLVGARHELSDATWRWTRLTLAFSAWLWLNPSRLMR